jgi:CxxC motif-containing protein (DUF1111 family)
MSRLPDCCPVCSAPLEMSLAAAGAASMRCPRCRVRVGFLFPEGRLTPPPPCEEDSAGPRSPSLQGVRELAPFALFVAFPVGLALAAILLSVSRRDDLAKVASTVSRKALAWAVPSPQSREVTKDQIDALDDELALGEALFHRDWAPGVPLNEGGDGLGPAYNERSCVGCHFLGGSGGAGPLAKNVEIANARSTTPEKALVAAHPGFREAQSLVIHRFGTDPRYDPWRVAFLGKASLEDARAWATSPALDDLRGSPPGANPAGRSLEEVREELTVRSFLASRPDPQFRQMISRSGRNPTALFGAGLIDALPEEALVAAEDPPFERSPKIRGRVNRLADGRAGRFGWKAQTASLEDFVLTACAVELGLEVPGHHQSALPQAPESSPAGLDLTGRQCEALTAYVRSLRAARVRPLSPEAAEEAGRGERLFHNVGCATCHRPELGGLQGIYSDLLLHDMGRDLPDTGTYHGFDPSPPPPADPGDLARATGDRGSPAPRRKPRPAAGPTAQEWRTPPLWGYRDSAPYLHDGRAFTLEEAVAAHGGEADDSAVQFFQLNQARRELIRAFLESLAAPDDLAFRQAEE